jgi:hypothetical protein
MTKIIFDIKRDNGYGKEVYLKGSLSWQPIQNSTTNVKPNMTFELGLGAIEFSVEPTDGTFLWTVTESIATSGGTFLTYQRVVSVPESDEPINYLDLPDADANTILETPEIS